MKNRKLLLIVSLVLALTMSLGGTLAYLTDTDEAVNVMTLGNVDIEQHEQERVDQSKLPTEEGNLRDFTQGKPLYPAYYEKAIGWNAASEADSAWKVFESAPGILDKFVTVENTGSSDAYVRTLIAFEDDKDQSADKKWIHLASNGTEMGITLTPVDGLITVGDSYFTVYEYLYNEALEPGETSVPSLKQVYLDKEAGNDVVAQYKETYDILVLSQAVQTINMPEDAGKALDAAFGDVTKDTAQKWFADVYSKNGLPTTTVKTAAELQAALNEGGIVVLANDITVEDTITVPAGVTATLTLAGHTISQTKACTESYAMIANRGNLTINGNGKLIFTDTGAGDPTHGWGSYTVRNEGTLVVEDGIIEHLGTQEFAKHCMMAIYQYSGSTTINGGTISCPNYRSVRLWHGDMTINGGTFDGQIWLQGIDAPQQASLTINGGTFGPNGGDGSSVFVGNNSDDISFAVTGGHFTTKIGCSDADALAGCITGGTFTDDAKANTNPVLFAE